MNDEIKFCINCGHCKATDKPYRCANFRDLVTGEPRPCIECRAPLGLCGEHAQFFTPKKKRTAK